MLKFIRIFHSGSAMWIYRQFLCCAEYKYLHQNSWSAFPDAHHGEHHLQMQRQFCVFLLHLQVLFPWYRQSGCDQMDSAQPLPQDYPNAQQFFRCCQIGKYQMLPARRHLQNYKQSVRKIC